MGALLTSARAGDQERKDGRVPYRRKPRRTLLEVAMLLLSGVLVASAPAQVTTSAQPGTGTTPQQLAKSVHNPFEDFLKVPLQSTTGFSIGAHHNVGESLNIQPAIPFSVNAEWDLIARPSLSVNYQPSPGEQFGLNDLQTSFFLTPHSADESIWGAGPIFSSRRQPVMSLGPADGAPVRPQR